MNDDDASPPDKIYSPWTDEQVAALNVFQASDWFPSFTCGNDRDDTTHRAFADYSRTEPGRLRATNSGWRCPACSYRQTWAWRFMLEAPQNPFDTIRL